MDDIDLFARERDRLVGLAYRAVGSRAEAEDLVQDVWCRWQAADRSSIERPSAWLTTVTARLALDALRSARHRRETYVGPWLPEPIESPIASDPADYTELAESLRLGFLVLLDSLSEIERVVFLMADVFDVPFAEVAEVVEKSPAACRQIAVRARARVREGRERLARPSSRGWDVVGALAGALSAGDVEAVMRLVRDDVVLTSDGGPHHRAARRPVIGPHRVSRFMVNLASRLPDDAEYEVLEANGDPAVCVRVDGQPLLVLVFEVADDLIAALRAYVNPEKFARLTRR